MYAPVFIYPVSLLFLPFKDYGGTQANTNEHKRTRMIRHKLLIDHHRGCEGGGAAARPTPHEDVTMHVISWHASDDANCGAEDGDDEEDEEDDGEPAKEAQRKKIPIWLTEHTRSGH